MYSDRLECTHAQTFRPKPNSPGARFDDDVKEKREKIPVCSGSKPVLHQSIAEIRPLSFL